MKPQEYPSSWKSWKSLFLLKDFTEIFMSGLNGSIFKGRKHGNLMNLDFPLPQFWRPVLAPGNPRVVLNSSYCPLKPELIRHFLSLHSSLVAHHLPASRSCFRPKGRDWHIPGQHLSVPESQRGWVDSNEPSTEGCAKIREGFVWQGSLFPFWIWYSTPT